MKEEQTKALEGSVHFDPSWLWNSFSTLYFQNEL